MIDLRYVERSVVEEDGVEISNPPGGSAHKIKKVKVLQWRQECSFSKVEYGKVYPIGWTEWEDVRTESE